MAPVTKKNAARRREYTLRKERLCRLKTTGSIPKELNAFVATGEKNLKER